MKVGVVPFAAAVNVGPHYKTAAWMDTAGASPVHFENFAEPKTRFELLRQMGVGLGRLRRGAARPRTTSPTACRRPARRRACSCRCSTPTSPIRANAGGDSYGNNYLPDYGGSCPVPPRTCLRYEPAGQLHAMVRSRRRCPPAEAQARTCKYEGASIGSAQGPNYLCDSKPILPLTTDKASVVTMIQGLIAKGGTNILEGLMWGWRVLSPEAPFTEGRAYNDAENTKYPDR